MVTSQSLESLDDLDLLVSGDVVQMVYLNYWNLHDHCNEYLAAYHASREGMLHFLVKTPTSETNITMYQARKDLIQVKDGKVLLKEDNCVIQTVGSGHYSYRGLNDTLLLS